MDNRGGGFSVHAGVRDADVKRVAACGRSQKAARNAHARERGKS